LHQLETSRFAMDLNRPPLSFTGRETRLKTNNSLVTCFDQLL
jgi:hypothetical protein